MRAGPGTRLQICKAVSETWRLPDKYARAPPDAFTNLQICPVEKLSINKLLLRARTLPNGEPWPKLISYLFSYSIPSQLLAPRASQQTSFRSLLHRSTDSSANQRLQATSSHTSLIMMHQAYSKFTPLLDVPCKNLCHNFLARGREGREL